MESKDLRTLSHGLLLVAAMLGLIAAALWLRPQNLEPQAQAQAAGPYRVMPANGIPDDGRQRQQMVEHLEALNRRLADMDRAFREGAYAVQAVEPKDPAGRPAAAKGTAK